MKPHKHAEFIKLMADGARIERRGVGKGDWITAQWSAFSFNHDNEFRISPNQPADKSRAPRTPIRQEAEMKLEDVPTPVADGIWERHSEDGDDFSYDLYLSHQTVEKKLGLAVAALQHVDSKIGHFAKAPHDESAVVSLIGDLARNVKETLAQIEKGTK